MCRERVMRELALKTLTERKKKSVTVVGPLARVAHARPQPHRLQAASEEPSGRGNPPLAGIAGLAGATFRQSQSRSASGMFDTVSAKVGGDKRGSQFDSGAQIHGASASSRPGPWRERGAGKTGERPGPTARTPRGRRRLVSPGGCSTPFSNLNSLKA